MKKIMKITRDKTKLNGNNCAECKAKSKKKCKRATTRMECIDKEVKMSYGSFVYARFYLYYAVCICVAYMENYLI